VCLESFAFAIRSTQQINQMAMRLGRNALSHEVNVTIFGPQLSTICRRL